MEKVGIIFGGRSVEHDISIITGLQIFKIAKKNYDIFPIYIDGNGVWWTAKNLSDVSIYSDFNKRAKAKKRVSISLGDGNIYVGLKKIKLITMIVCMHGVNGEDGSIAAVLEQAKINYTSSSILSSAVTMDKSFTKMILNFYGIKNPDFTVVKREEMKNLNIEKILNELGLPLIVKPANLGSSVGISVCHSSEDLNTALEIAFNFDDKIVVEKYLNGSEEYNCACFKYKNKCYLSNVINVEKNEIFSFEEKYIKEKDEFKKEIDEGLKAKIKDLTETVYRIFDCFGVVRVDYLILGHEIFVNEINSIPGALSCYMFNEKFDEILDLIIKESEFRWQNRERIKYSFKSDALKVFENEEKLTRFKK